MKRQKKYIALKGVRIETRKVARELRSLLPYAKEWCFLGDNEVYRHLHHSTEAAVREFVSHCESKLNSLEQYCFDKKHPTPLPDEIVLFQTMYQNFVAARSHIWLLDSRRS